jgi:hypothetical protein
MTTTTRRTTATTAAAADKANRRRRPSDYVAGSGAVTVSERAAAADGIAAGAKQRLRLAAREIVETCAALRADGCTLPDGAYRMPDTDPETGEQLDAREVLRAAAERARPGRGFGIGANDPARLTAADVAALANYGARCAARMARPRLSADESADVAADITLAIIARGARGILPRWDALAPADWQGAPTAADRTRDRWRGFAYVTARALVIRDRGARLAAEVPADWTPAADGADPTPEQRAAAAADTATAALTDALEGVAPLTHFLAATAPGGALKSAEGDALALALSGMTRAQIAAARGADANTVKVGAKRGRAALLKRCPEQDTARRWARAAARRMARITTAPTDVDRLAALAAAAAAPYRGVRLSWPDRVAHTTPEGDYIIPPAPAGAGTRANVPATAHNPAGPESGRVSTTARTPRTLPAHRYRVTAIRAARTLAATAVPAPSALDTTAAVILTAAHRPPTGHPGSTPDLDAIRRDGNRAREQGARMDANLERQRAEHGWR